MVSDAAPDEAEGELFARKNRPAERTNSSRIET